MNEFETQDIQCGQTLTYHDFFERFNAISCGYHACGTNRGGVAIITDTTHVLKASLDAGSRTWDFKASAFNWNELNLMAQLAANLPEFRGEIDND